MNRIEISQEKRDTVKLVVNGSEIHDVTRFDFHCDTQANVTMTFPVDVIKIDLEEI